MSTAKVAAAVVSTDAPGKAKVARSKPANGEKARLADKKAKKAGRNTKAARLADQKAKKAKVLKPVVARKPADGEKPRKVKKVGKVKSATSKTYHAVKLARKARRIEARLEMCCPSLSKTIVQRMFHKDDDAVLGNYRLSGAAAALISAHGGHVLNQLARGTRDVLNRTSRKTAYAADVRTVARVAGLLPYDTAHNQRDEVDMINPTVAFRRAQAVHDRCLESLGKEKHARAKAKAQAAATAAGDAAPKKNKSKAKQQ